MAIIKKTNNNNAGKDTRAENINWFNNCETEDGSSINENRITVSSSTSAHSFILSVAPFTTGKLWSQPRVQATSE